MVRALLLFLSRQKQLRQWMETSQTARRLATRFVAGETLDQALAVARKLNGEGITVTLDHLGESVNSLDEAAAACDVYLRTLDAIQLGGVHGNVSLKLSQFGIDLSEAECRSNVERLVGRAAECGNFVRVDMESSEYTDRTLALVRDLHAKHGSVGTVIQAYLYRSKADIEELCQRGIRDPPVQGRLPRTRGGCVPQKDGCGCQLYRPDEAAARSRNVSCYRHA